GDAATSAHRRTPVRHPVGLRAARHALLGRAHDLAAVDAAWADARLVTVLGTGGLGKTTLVQEVGRRAQDDAWVVVVELAGVRSDADVETAIASALGLAHARSARLGDRLPATTDATGRIAERLGEVPTLLVLDNCEHVVAGAAQCADALLAAVPGLRVLTTSRTPLLVAGERVHPLAPLPVDGGHGAAVELFRERARAARPGVALPLEVVARIATRLDGLPLAIELAAARVRTMTVEEVERRLDARFALLRSGDRLAPDRHRTLEAVIDWSWHLLGDDEQRVLRRLSVLPDGFDLDAAAALGRLTTAPAVTGDGAVATDGAGTDDAWDVLDALDGLVLQSLCSVVEDRGEGDDEPVVRYRMLETVREFGHLRLTEAGEHDAALDAMLAWALAFADRWAPALVDGDQPAAMRALRREQDNLLLAFRTALDRGLTGEAYALYVALTGYWSLRGAHEQVFGLGIDLLAGTHGWRVAPRHADAAALALTELAAMGIFGDAGSTARALARLRLVVRELGSHLGPRTRAFAGLALAGSVAGMARELADLRRSSDTYLAMLGHMLSAQLAENSGRLEVARRWVEEAYALGVARGDVWAEANNASFLAQLAAEEGLAQEALRWVSVARTGMGRLVAEEELHQVAWLELAASVGVGDLATARDRCDALAEVAASGRMGRTTWQSPELVALERAGRGEIAAAEGDVAAALDHLQAAYDAFGPDGGGERTSPWFIMITVGWIARLVLAPEAVRAARPAPSTPAPALARHVHEWQRVRAADAVDHPVLGTAAVGLGTAAWAGSGDASRVDDGLELFFLAELLGSRQDLPMLHRAPLDARARELLGTDRTDAARARARAVGRRHAATRALALVDALWR
ncbi:ATP-binding protein, partial [Cellulomonas algicola]|uniref:ATP-binding protein n=1 Tax=Cellulomonas algicola TaxID=2071633 RepID=UPI001358B103